MSSKLRRHGKLNYAAVRFGIGCAVAKIRICCRGKGVSRLILSLDIFIFAAYFKLHNPQYERRLEEARSQARTPESPWRAESSSRTCARALVSVGRLLRCQRSHSGQVRDAAPRPCRWRIQGRSRSVIWCISPDLLSGRGGIRARWIAWPRAEAARTERRAQTRHRCDGLHRAAHGRRWIDSRSSVSRTTRNRARYLGSPPQHRTRNSAQKKTIEPAAAGDAPAGATVAAYEALRTAVIDGTPRPEGAAALRYHGMLHGLPMLVETVRPRDAHAPGHESVAHSLQPNGEFVRLLASLLLHTHSELVHVY
jgi:hypothetical protein